ncbi:methyltransferase domain-containing protein [Streptacidiphilus sp. PB12-B1b]|nr:methyltransferase domain-containing protein [Streptacidiphilus sp. PB12-B1b]
MDQSFWEERYRSRSVLWSGHVNPQLVAEAARLAPGAALDVGCGEGGDALWLAERGWRVTAVDFGGRARCWTPRAARRPSTTRCSSPAAPAEATVPRARTINSR